MTRQPDLNRLIDLHRLLLAFQSIDRQTDYGPANSERAENDAEHSYSLAVMAWFLAAHFSGLDRGRVIRIALAHDLVEIYAGDTPAFTNDASLDGKPGRELDALRKLSAEWSDFAELTDAMREYKECASEEAKFVYALDKIMPIILNYIHEGSNWRKHEITLEQLHTVKADKIKVSSIIDEYYQQLYALLQDNPHFFHQKHKT